MKNKCENKANCNLATCRYNRKGICQNEEKRKECVDVSKLVLCISDEKEKNPFNICDTNPDCECDPINCGFAVEYSTFEEVGNGIHKFMCGLDKCKYQK